MVKLKLSAMGNINIPSTPMGILLFSLIFSTEILHYSSSVRILGVPTWPGVSHENVFNAVWKELALRGHQVTALVTGPTWNRSLPNLKEIDVSLMYDIARAPVTIRRVKEAGWVWERMSTLMEGMEMAMEEVFKMEEVQKMLGDEGVGFDLIIVEPHHPLGFAFGAKYKVPIIALSSLDVFLNIHDTQGNPTHPILNPDIHVDKHPQADNYLLDFYDKFISVVYNCWYRIYYYRYVLPRSDRIARRYFGQDIPYIGDILSNISLVVTNVNPIVNSPRPNVPSVIQVEQLHVDKRPLTEDLQSYLDSSRNGVVYFSLGTHVDTSEINNQTIRTIMEAFGELPYDVLWKCEMDHFPGKPSNVELKKWLPQQAVLNHLNVKVFVTQGGLQSIEEAILAGVPMVGIPFWSDQPLNVKRLVDKGMAEFLDIKKLTRQGFKEAVMNVATNPRYKSKVLEAKRILEDQPIKGLDKVVWWVEYVLRHGGGQHLKGPAANMSLIQYFMLDIFVLVSIAVVTIMIVSVKLFELFGKSFKSLFHRKKD